MTSPEPLLRISDAAEMLGVSADTLRNWADKGLIPYLRPPKSQRYFRRSDIDAFLRAHKRDISDAAGAA